MNHSLSSVRRYIVVGLLATANFFIVQTGFAQTLGTMILQNPIAPSVSPETNASVDYYYSCYGACQFYTEQAKDANKNDTFVWHEKSGTEWGGEVYIGMKSPFDAVAYQMATWGASNQEPVYEYLNANGVFSPLSVTTVGNHFRTPTPDGIAKISFSVPGDWTVSKLHQADAYWIRIKAPEATAIPKASRVGVRAYNVKGMFVVREKSGTNESVKNPVLGSISAVAEKCPSSSSVLVKEFNAGNGIHYYAVPRTDGGNCTLLFSYAPKKTHGKKYVTFKASSSLSDIGEVEFLPFIRVALQDEDGNAVSDAKVTFNGLPPAFIDASSDLTPGAADYFFTPSELYGNNSVKITRPGYVNKPEPSVAAGFVEGSDQQLKQIKQYYNESIQILLLKGQKSCKSQATMPNPVHCSPLRRNSTFTAYEKVGNKNIPVNGATIEVYKDPSFADSSLADDVLKLGQQDAKGETSDKNGSVSFGLAENGKYYIRVSKPGYDHAFFQKYDTAYQFQPIELKRRANVGNAHFDHVLIYTTNPASPGMIFKNVTQEAKNSELEDVYVPASNSNTKQYLYLGSDSPFDGIKYGVARWASGQVAYEYSGSFKDLNGNVMTAFKPLKLKVGNANHLNSVSPVGRAEAAFNLPSDWVKTTVNGVEAYWMRLSTVGISPNFNSVGMNAYNVSVSFKKSEKQPNGTYQVQPYAGNVRVVSSCSILKEMNAGAGLRRYAVDFPNKPEGSSDAAETKCQMTFSLPPGANASGYTLHTQSLSASTESKLHALDVVFDHRIKVAVMDEVGNPLTSAKVSWGSVLAVGQSKNQPAVYLLNPKTRGTAALKVIANGYVTEQGKDGRNAGLSSVIPGVDKPTIVVFGPTDTQECDASIGAGDAVFCARLKRDLTVRVQTGAGLPVDQANVTVHTNAAKTLLGDDLSKNVPGNLKKDAQGKTDAAGASKFAMATGLYWITASKNGASKTVSAKVTTGIENLVIIEIDPPATSSDCFDTSKPCTPPTSTTPDPCKSATGAPLPCPPDPGTPTTSTTPGTCIGFTGAPIPCPDETPVDPNSPQVCRDVLGAIIPCPPFDPEKLVCRDANGREVPCPVPDPNKPICRDSIGRVIPCPVDDPTKPPVCRDAIGRVIPCPVEDPSKVICRDSIGRVIPCPTDTTKKLLRELKLSALGPTTITTGQMVALEVVALFSDGSQSAVTPECGWYVSDPSVGVIQNGKFVSLAAAGQVTVACTYTNGNMKLVRSLPITVQLDPALTTSSGGDRR